MTGKNMKSWGFFCSRVYKHGSNNVWLLFIDICLCEYNSPERYGSPSDVKPKHVCLMCIAVMFCLIMLRVMGDALVITNSNIPHSSLLSTPKHNDRYNGNCKKCIFSNSINISIIVTQQTTAFQNRLSIFVFRVKLI